MRRRVVGRLAGGVLASAGLLFFTGVFGAPPLNQKAERLQKELETDLPRGSGEAAIQLAFRKRGWDPMFDPILNNYGFLIKQNTGKDGILVRVWLDVNKRADKVEVKAIYSPDLG